MADKEVRVILTAEVDDAMKKIHDLESEIKGLAEVGGATKAFKSLWKGADRNFTQGLSAISGVAKGVASAVGAVTSQFLELTETVTGTDVSFNGLAKSALDYEQTMKQIEALTQKNNRAWGEQRKLMTQLDQKAMELGENSKFTATEIAQGMEEMVHAGMDVESILGSINSVTAVATIGNMELAESAELVATALTMFKKTGVTADDVANTLNATALKSATTVEDLGQALSNSGAIAGNLGISIQDVGTVLGIFGNNAITGSRAGTALKNVLQRMTTQTGQAGKAIEKYNLQGARQKIVTGDLIGGLKEICDQAEKYNLSSEEMLELSYQLAGAYGMNGLYSVLSLGSQGIERFRRELEATSDAETIMEMYMQTLTGQLQVFTARLTTGAIKIREALNDSLVYGMSVINEFTKYLLDGDLHGAFKYLAKESENWGKALYTGVQEAIGKLNNFLNEGGLRNILKIGTNIIEGICDGIKASASTGALQKAIDTIIKDVGTWITTNGDTLLETGKLVLESICQGIKDNPDIVADAVDTIFEISNFIDEAKGKVLGEAIATRMGSWITQGLKGANGGKGVFGDFSNSLLEAMGLGGGTTTKEQDAGGKKLDLSPKNIWQKIKKAFMPDKAFADEVYEGAKPIGSAMSDGTKDGMEEKGQQIVDSANKTGTDSANSIQQALESMDIEYLKSMGTEMATLGTVTTETATSMSTSFTNIANSARTQFLNVANIVRNQMTNVSNIVRNQMLNCTNIIRNQAVNMANIVRNQALNMSNIFRNQFVNMANIVRNQMVNCANIVRNQCVNMANIFRNQFVNMANITRNQMLNIANIVRNQMLNCTNIVRNQSANMSNALSQGMSKMASSAQSAMNRVLSVIRSAMAQARAIASAPITINIQSNISRKVTTTHVAGGLKQTMANIGANSLSIGAPNVMSGGRQTISPVTTSGGSYTFTIPVSVDGREIARATAKYSQSELDRLAKRNSRKRGE